MSSRPAPTSVGLRVPGSYVDRAVRLDRRASAPPLLPRERHQPGGRHRLGGGRARPSQKYPTITPDELKKLFHDHTNFLDGVLGAEAGPGRDLDLATMLVGRVVNPSKSWNRIPWSTGTGITREAPAGRCT